MKEAPQPLPKEVVEAAWKEGKKERHLDNIQMLTGWYHGTYFENGVVRPKREKDDNKTNLGSGH